ncbi:carbohydrate-binding module family 18 protein/Glycoside hydrolase family 16 protein [Dothistroma septosporum NZE10]|uniref:Crh-like protein n=1 Tax=Dothistroma septosporum (strain NZE10 / CBS 128990) TaxID=675120 RepID=N1PS25_DOTSN|nr:carbohydrate-binding module family 18 protein/Glycoside hydrolase family 16 protein [Dothistroma septosporum NZE10]
MKYILAAAAVVATTFAQSAPTCDPDNLCPQSAPCCSQYGQCGVGAYCLGGCDPKSSFSLQSCMAAPVCKSGDFKMDSLDDVAANTVYLGDTSTGVNWVSSGKPVTYNGNSLLLTMAPSTVGTLLTSTHYVWYGKISATMTSSQGQGVVTAFILMSDVKDEIDFEFVGDDVQSAQSNYYFQGITDYHNMVPLNTTDTRQNTHTYTVDWTPDTLIWSIDGQEMRTLKKSDTWNSTDQSYHYPQTPSRVQLSLWPAGLASNGEGTVSWAGGLVNWNSQYMQNGYYYAMVNDVSVECYDPPSGFSNNFGSNAYYYTSRVGTNDTVAIGNNNTVLASFMATGDNPDAGKKSSGTQSASSASTSATDTPESVPGISGGGNAAVSDVNPATGQGSGSSSSGSSGSSSGTTDSSGSSGFSQGGGSSGNSSDAPKIVAGSAVALLGFFIAALML